MPKNLTPTEAIVHKALQDAVKQDDARIVLAVIMTEASSLARAIRQSGKLNEAQIAKMWGDTLVEALEAYVAPSTSALNS